MLTSSLPPMAPYIYLLYFSWLSCSSHTKFYQENPTRSFFPHFAPQFLVGCHPRGAPRPHGLWLPIYPGAKKNILQQGSQPGGFISFPLHRQLLQVSVLCFQGAEICNFNTTTSFVSPALGALGVFGYSHPLRPPNPAAGFHSK